jgi:hypothetical protein
MRKAVNNFDTLGPRPHSQEEWLDLEQIARVEVTSEDPNFPIESALSANEGPGWRAADPGEQIIRIVLDNPRPLRRIRLEFSETKIERTQEFALRWSQAGGPFRESFASSGTSARKAQPAKSKITRSIWTVRRPWS